MEIKLRGKVWKQITPKEFRETKENTAMFIDYKYDEKTYFRQINVHVVKDKTQSQKGVE